MFHRMYLRESRNCCMSLFFSTLKKSPALLLAAFAAFFCTFLLVYALTLEHFFELAPCPLCIAQRFFFFLIALSALAYLWWPRVVTERIVGIKVIGYALLGGALAARQVWMQWHPVPVDPTRCGVSFGSFIDQLLQALGGSGNCAQVDWTLLTLSLAEWSLLSFTFLLAVGGWFLWRSFRLPKYE